MADEICASRMTAEEESPWEHKEMDPTTDIPSGEEDYSTRDPKMGTVDLFGIPIVCLSIDDKERLCLAQISNTLLRDFSYNEIHNRRVALGITCLQCTPVQLEILRRTGAMPVSSRRCGLITKREAERLVKSFLEAIPPPRLPENFSFSVYHNCGWGCQGQFIPSRYNSSRAKCIKCLFCNAFFSPNKFIFHYHKSSTSTYRHPDAANFNSWRRHLLLIDPNPTEKLLHSWEDVKSMFNGGCRKKMSACNVKVPGHSVKPFKLEQSCRPTSLTPISRYGTTAPSIVKIPERAHPAFSVGSQSGSGIGSYGDMLRSFSMQFNPWWKPWYMSPNQIAPVDNSFMLPFNMQEGRGDVYPNSDDLQIRKPRTLPIPYTESASSSMADKKSTQTDGFNIASIIGKKSSSFTFDQECKYPLSPEDGRRSDPRHSGNERMERKRKVDNPQRIHMEHLNRSSPADYLEDCSSTKSAKHSQQDDTPVDVKTGDGKEEDVDVMTFDDTGMVSFTMDQLQSLLTQAKDMRKRTTVDKNTESAESLHDVEENIRTT